MRRVVHSETFDWVGEEIIRQARVDGGRKEHGM